jgi:hypothetical protein
VGSKQWLWLDAQLSAVDRSQTPFVIVSGHRPFYTSSLQEDKYGPRHCHAYFLFR